ncbi:MAG: hypothetical protein A2698_00570 [Candidatus Levybacteria bacterium RIFCSPHIGHO2_01_FULL_42_15]|nr:MAG: hypothetical protein A2698_00570 [Candidatus Levybacteria bacterium RIFCSPHIGHO2_01_FULL_42_15]
MNKIILLGIIVLLIGIGAFFFRNSPNKDAMKEKSQPTTEAQTTFSTPSGEVTISVTKSGFEPTTATIKTGTKVTWVNNSGNAATVNSDDHPFHKLYPKLNLGEFTESSSVQMMFTEKGTYTYHDHLNPEREGTIVVE